MQTARLIGAMYFTTLLVLIHGAFGYGIAFILDVILSNVDVNRWLITYIACGFGLLHGVIYGFRVIVSLRKVEKEFGNFPGIKKMIENAKIAKEMQLRRVK